MISIKLIIFIFLTFLTKNIIAQNIIPFKDYKTSLWGMKDTVKNKIVLKPKFILIQKIHYYDYYYYTLKQPKDKESVSLQGLISPNGKVIIKPIYNSIKGLNGGEHFEVSKMILNHKTGKTKRVVGIINGKGKVIVPIEQNYIDSYGIIKYFYTGQRLLKNKKFGVVDLKSSTCTERKYDVVDDLIMVERQFNENGDFLIDHYTLIDSSTKTVTEPLGYLSKVSDHHYLAKGLTCDKKSVCEFMGIINNKGQTVIPFKHHEIEKIGKVYLASTSEKRNNKLHIHFTTYNYKGEVIPFLDNKYVIWNVGNLLFTKSNHRVNHPIQSTYDLYNLNGENVIQDCPNLIKPKKKYPKLFKIVSENIREQLYGYINLKGEIIIPPIHTEIEYPKSNFILAQKESKYGIYDTNGVCIIPFEYDFIRIENEFIVKKNNVYNLLDQKGEKLTSTEYSNISSIIYLDSLYFVSHNGKKGIINKTDQLIIPIEFEEIKSLDDSLLFVINHNKEKGIYRIDGAIVLPVEYDYIQVSFHKNIIAASKDGLYKLFNKFGKPINSKSYYEINFTSNQLIIARNENNKLGLVNEKGDEISNFIYDFIFPERNESLINVSINFKYGFLDESGEEIIPIEYDDIEYPKQGLILASKNEKYGYLNLKGEIVIPFIYDYARSFNNSRAEVRINSETFIINLKGERIE